jgi:hypothetical protein
LSSPTQWTTEEGPAGEDEDEEENAIASDEEDTEEDNTVAFVSVVAEGEEPEEVVEGEDTAEMETREAVRREEAAAVCVDGGSSRTWSGVPRGREVCWSVGT